MTESTATRCGVVAIIGEPNAGKSTLINRLVGGKVSIVSPKVQTTRFNVRGVMVEGQSQLIFVDTPGIFDAGKKFEKAMVQAAWSGIGDADAAILLLDARIGLRDSTRQLIQSIKDTGRKNIFLALNKIDTIDKPTLMELAKAASQLADFKSVFMISASKGHGVKDLAKKLGQAMPESPWLYPEDQMSDIPMRLLAAEVTREKLFLKLDQELPYSIHVETEKWEESDTLVRIAQVITVQREGQKKIVIGEKGSMLKEVGMSSRLELAKSIGKKVHLELFVKVRSGWKDDRETYSLLGLDYKG